MERPIDEILSEQPEAAVEPAAAPETPEELASPPSPVVDPPSGVLRDEKGRFAPKETGVEEPAQVAEQVPPTEQVNQLPKEEYTALRAIRDENRELKRHLAQIEQRLSQPAQPATPPPDFWDDPHGYMSSQFASFGEQLLGQFEQRQQVQRLNASEEAAKARYADYDEAYLAFEQAVQHNPRLAVELAQSSDPGEFAYSKGKAALAIQTVGSLDALKAQIRAEVEAEAKAHFQPAQRLVLPSTTAADGSVGGRSGPDWGGPQPLGQILGK